MQEDSRVAFDAQCDLAAIVYGADDDPDRLFIDFADDLSSSGLRVVGLVQVGRSCKAEDPVLSVVVMPEGKVAPLVKARRTCVADCQIDTGCLAGVARRLSDSLADGADLVIINRFGRAEAEGKGLTDLITCSVDADIPVLIAVPEHRFSAWIRFSNGMNVRLACRRDALDRWWRSLVGPATRRRPNDPLTFCEIAK